MGTKEKKENSPEPFVKTQVKEATRITTDGLKNFAASKKTLFGEIRKSLEILKGQKNKKAAMKEYKRVVAPYEDERKKRPHGSIDRSTLNKIIKICETDIIVKNLTRLPESWGTLAYLATEEVAKKVGELLETKAIGLSSSLSECQDAYAKLVSPEKSSSEPEADETEQNETENPFDTRSAEEDQEIQIKVAGNVFPIQQRNLEKVGELISSLKELGVELSYQPVFEIREAG